MNLAKKLLNLLLSVAIILFSSAFLLGANCQPKAVVVSKAECKYLDEGKIRVYAEFVEPYEVKIQVRTVVIIKDGSYTRYNYKSNILTETLPVSQLTLTDKEYKVNSMIEKFKCDPTKGNIYSHEWIVPVPPFPKYSVNVIGYPTEYQRDREMDNEQIFVDGPGYPSPSPEVTPLTTVTPTPSPTPEPVPTVTPCITLTHTMTPKPASTPESTPSPAATPTPSSTPKPAAAPTSTASPTDTPASAPTDTPTPLPTDTPTSAPTDTPTTLPTDTPTSTPTDTPTPLPTDTPTSTPTDTPTPVPTNTPVPTATPTPTPEYPDPDAMGCNEIMC